MTGARLAIRSIGLVVALSVAACNDSPTAPTDAADSPITTPVSVSFTGVVGPGGTASRSFTAQIAGTAVASLAGINPATALGVGLGIPRADGTGCLLRARPRPPTAPRRRSPPGSMPARSARRSSHPRRRPTR